MSDEAYREICCAICGQAVYDLRNNQYKGGKRKQELMSFFESSFFKEWTGMTMKQIQDLKQGGSP